MAAAAAVFAAAPVSFDTPDLPAAWLGNVPHTHRAIDDARGYANLLGELFRRAGAA